MSDVNSSSSSSVGSVAVFSSGAVGFFGSDGRGHVFYLRARDRD